ncbi:ATP-binding protein [Photobacterium lipolyticum]|uniref:histidine kinase n=1 Tax=Photobacterium lipolyticum TaxID=266810 RepID=A0A2T3N0G5_9GAMM|nr:ATP-binding protein [Photobacterium lipolyticum]PSW05667.1 hypothetical protein C9I89_07920 [Photobacterium lipolyticum]
MKRELLEQRPFEFSARVTLQLGRESISSSTVAISELIKNSYDADSDSVGIDFTIRKYGVSTLVIKDTGHGMSSDMLLDNWLKIGTDNKSVYGYSQSGRRVLTGAKGLGRLGIDRLCKKLVLYTKTKDMDHAIQLNIDWKRFEKTNQSISEIKHDVYKVQLPVRDKYGDIFIDEKDSGTRMLLIGLKDDWNTSFLSILENELRLLVSPFQAKNEFEITLTENRKNETTKKVINSERFLRLARWKVKAGIDSDGFISATYINENREIEVIQDKIAWKDWIKTRGETPKCGPVEFEFYYIPQDDISLNKVNLRRTDFRKFMNLNQGVRIYRDHFRVRPYGEPSGKGDWLDIGYRKAASPGGISQGGWRVGPNQILGSVLISRETNKVLDDQANREGIVENDAFFDLRTFLLKILETFEYLAHKDAKSIKKSDLAAELSDILAKTKQETEEAIERLKESVSSKPKIKRSNKKKQLSRDDLITSRLKTFESAQQKLIDAQKKYEDALITKNDTLEKEKNTLSNLASLGILTVCFGHEIRQHSALASNNAYDVEETLLESKDDLVNLDVDACISAISRVVKSTEYINNFSNFALANIKPDKRKRGKVNIPKVFRYVFDVMSESLETMGLDADVIVNGDESGFNVKSYEIDWESIAINLITNSMWAVELKPKEERKIEVEFTMIDDKTIEMIFTDSGVGLEQGAETEIFIPMNSSKRDNTGNAIGTGMGLAIVKTNIEDHVGGSLKALCKGRLGGAEFIFNLPVGR